MKILEIGGISLIGRDAPLLRTVPPCDRPDMRDWFPRLP